MPTANEMYNETYLGPRIGPQYTRTFPNDIELELAFPPQIKKVEDKVIYSLWKEGEQSYYNLRLLTGALEDDFNKAITLLQEQDRIVPNDSRKARAGEWEYVTFSLNPNYIHSKRLQQHPPISSAEQSHAHIVECVARK